MWALSWRKQEICLHEVVKRLRYQMPSFPQPLSAWLTFRVWVWLFQDTCQCYSKSYSWGFSVRLSKSSQQVFQCYSLLSYLITYTQCQNKQNLCLIVFYCYAMDIHRTKLKQLSQASCVCLHVCLEHVGKPTNASCTLHVSWDTDTRSLGRARE